MAHALRFAMDPAFHVNVLAALEEVINRKEEL
jgi:hypothetical protein